MGKEVVILTREELYDLIWSKPTTALAKELGISDVGLGKICKRMEVPKPPIGYWRKVEVGARPSKRPKLKKLSPKGQQQVTIRPTVPESKSMQAIKAAELIPCQTELVDPHRLTKKTIASFNNGKCNERGILLSRNKVHLDIHVSQQSLDRACLIMDTLIKACENRGFLVGTVGERPLKTIIEVDGENIEISLDESVRRTDHRPTTEEEKKYKYSWLIPKYDYHPSGNLVLNIKEWHAPRKKWADGKRQKLESCLGSFIQGLREAAIAIKAAREQRRLDEIRRAEEKKCREERERFMRIEKKKAEKLMADANAWYQAERIRCYIEKLESLPEVNSELAEWIEWAKSYVGNIDPLNDLDALPFIVSEHSYYF